MSMVWFQQQGARIFPSSAAAPGTKLFKSSVGACFASEAACGSSASAAPATERPTPTEKSATKSGFRVTAGACHDPGGFASEVPLKSALDPDARQNHGTGPALDAARAAVEAH